MIFSNEVCQVAIVSSHQDMGKRYTYNHRTTVIIQYEQSACV